MAPVPWIDCVGNVDGRRTANWRRGHCIFFLHFVCIHWTLAHFIRSSVCHLPWNVYLPLIGTRRWTVFQDRRQEPLCEFVVSAGRYSVAEMRQLTKGETIFSGKRCFEQKQKQQALWEDRFVCVCVCTYIAFSNINWILNLKKKIFSY